MSKRLKLILKIIGIVLLVLIIAVVIFANVMLSGIDETKALIKLENAGISFEQQFVKYQDHKINTYRIGNPALPKALLIHGSPGHWSDWINVVLDTSLLKEKCLIVLDRPGYGNTDMPASDRLVEQADVAATVMANYCSAHECFTLAGHSYGGGVVEQVLLDHPVTASKGIYVAGTLSPAHQPRKWYNYLASAWLVKWMVPKVMRSSNVEMMQLQSDLLKNDPRLPTIHQPLVLIQGTEDVLVPFETVEYYKNAKRAGVTYIIVEGMNHFIPWTDPEIIVEALRN